MPSSHHWADATGRKTPARNQGPATCRRSVACRSSRRRRECLLSRPEPGSSQLRGSDSEGFSTVPFAPGMSVWHGGSVRSDCAVDGHPATLLNAVNLGEVLAVKPGSRSTTNSTQAITFAAGNSRRYDMRACLAHACAHWFAVSKQRAPGLAADSTRVRHRLLRRTAARWSP